MIAFGRAAHANLELAVIGLRRPEIAAYHLRRLAGPPRARPAPAITLSFSRDRAAPGILSVQVLPVSDPGIWRLSLMNWDITQFSPLEGGRPAWTVRRSAVPSARAFRKKSPSPASPRCR